MRILIVEDEAPKLAHLSAFIRDLFPADDIQVMRSVKSSIELLESQRFDLLVLDMSLPTFDITSGERGGRPQGFGGKEIMLELERLKFQPAVIVVTQYPVFSDNGRDVSLDELTDSLRREFPGTFEDLIYFNSLIGGWREELAEAIQRLRTRGRV